MENLLKYKLFVEVRLSDVTTIIGDKNLFDINISDDDFLKFKTISKRINNKKIRLTINWNHTLQHDMIKRIHERTSLKSVSELNSLISNGLDELYINYLNHINSNNRYSLWFSEYNISIIVDIEYNKNNINVISILHGKSIQNVKYIIELKSLI